MGIEKNIKEQLNKEGVEKHSKGEATVLAGTKEEIEKARKLIESEGRAPDLESYIRLHKEIYLDKSEINKRSDEPFWELKFHFEKGLAWMRDNDFFYVDKDQNIARVYLDFDKIGSFSKSSPLGDEKSVFLNKAKQLGFRFNADTTFVNKIYEARIITKRKELQEQEKKREEGFDF